MQGDSKSFLADGDTYPAALTAGFGFHNLVCGFRSRYLNSAGIFLSH